MEDGLRSRIDMIEVAPNKLPDAMKMTYTYFRLNNFQLFFCTYDKSMRDFH